MIYCLHYDAPNDPKQAAGYCDECCKRLPTSNAVREQIGDDLFGRGWTPPLLDPLPGYDYPFPDE